MLFLLLFYLLFCPIVRTKFNLYNTDPIQNMDDLQVNCLHYYTRLTQSYIMEKTEFCLGPIGETTFDDADPLHISGKFTFDQLRHLNVDITQLLSWSATIDLAENYQYYLQHQNESFLSQEVFINCTRPWFGSQCEYSFDMDDISSFQKIVEKTLRQRTDSESSYDLTNLPCYIHLKCDRGGSGLCLDWREVCDGRIDCIDGGADEAQCVQLELNQCDASEYRCHNGLCIPKIFLDDDIPQCLDQSDLSNVYIKPYAYYFPHIFDYEEIACRPGTAQFSCGDGQCVTDYSECYNKRHLLLIDSISGQGHLSYSCWMLMMCLTKISSPKNELLCQPMLTSSNITATLQSCGELIQFPTVPVLFGHIRFLYSLKDDVELDMNLTLLPDYICYDQRLCDFLIPTFFFRSYSCRKRDEIDVNWKVKPNSWVSLIHLVNGYFRKCSTQHNIVQSMPQSPSLYCCKNSTKCISKHRILDNISDCYLNDDEEELVISCLIGDPLRFKCLDQSRCYSTVVSREICPVSRLRNLDDIDFREICDRDTNMYPLTIDGVNHTDETDCHDWPCSNYYTRCDGFWSCSNGKDEENCTKPMCPPHFLPCGSRYNYSFICLPAHQVEDGYIDCLGGLDELQYCRNIYDPTVRLGTFRCLDTNMCLDFNNVCDSIVDCPLGDDEAFCGDHRYICFSIADVDRKNYTNVENTICLLQTIKRIPFSLQTSRVYPSTGNSTSVRILSQRTEQHHVTRFTARKSDDSMWLWRCNHGLSVRHWRGGKNITYKCFCSPSYYGDRCQYQNQRIAFTARIRVINVNTVYTIMISLIDDSKDYQEINSYHKYTSLFDSNCERSMNGYLTYTRRVNNASTNYSVHFDVYNKTNLTYLASWYFPVPFSFLPVNRLVVALYLPLQPTPTSNKCPVICYNGQCTKYVNKQSYFCRCHPGWSGVRCDMMVDCNDCSNDSLCTGATHNRSVCVCPLLKGGLRCLLTFPSIEDFCENDGQFTVFDDGMNELGFVCLCSNEYHGHLCQIRYATLEISIGNIRFSSILLIYIIQLFSDEDNRKPLFKVTAQKLTMFQRTISLPVDGFYRMVFVKTDPYNYYLAVLQHEDHEKISTSIDSSRRCPLITELVTPHSLAWPLIRRIKSYHFICQTYRHLICSFDEPFMCLCTLQHHANCFRLQSTPPKCPDNSFCQNGGECFQDEMRCPTKFMCNCTDCFFGDRCQFQAKGIGLTLDDILRYEIRPHTSMHDQSNTLKWTCALTMIIFVAGLINSILSIITFRSKKSREVGCGIYLLASSITSLLTVSIFTLKFWFLFLTYTNLSINRSFHRGGCRSLEFILKVCLYVDSWLNAAVALDRAMTVHKGIYFNKSLSKRIARWMLIILPLLLIVSLIHEPLYRDLVDDSEEERVWCVLKHSSAIETYNRIILLFHSIAPFCINLFSALFIIFSGARRGTTLQKQKTYQEHLQQQFKEHKSLIISPIILVILTIPRVWIAFLSGCAKVSHNVWLYLSGYLVSFIPSMSIFIVFVCPSLFYREQFRQLLRCYRP